VKSGALVGVKPAYRTPHVNLNGWCRGAHRLVVWYATCGQSLVTIVGKFMIERPRVWRFALLALSLLLAACQQGDPGGGGADPGGGGGGDGY
jgi:hypothetical protein